MSVLHLRRDMVVAEEPVVEIETPFPLVAVEDRPGARASNDQTGKPKKSFARRVGSTVRWFVLIGLLAVYPALIVLSSDVGDREIDGLVDRTQWSAPWAGGAATVLEHHYRHLGWATDAPSWAPLGVLTAKPAFQAALAESVGEYVSLVARQASARGAPDTDLEAAARLLNANTTGVQLRAARDALVGYDGRVRARSGEPATRPVDLDARFSLIQQWAERSQTELVMTASMVGGSPWDEAATRTVYAAKGRAQAAYLFLDTIAWPDDSRALAARSEALAAWKAAAQFRPVFVFNGAPDAALFGNHASSMSFLTAQAMAKTQSYLAYFPSEPQDAAPADGVAAGPVDGA